MKDAHKKPAILGFFAGQRANPDDEADEVKNVVISRKTDWIYPDLRPTYDQIRGARQKLHTTNGYHLSRGIAVVYCRVLELSILGAFDERGAVSGLTIYGKPGYGSVGYGIAEYGKARTIKY